MKISEYLKETRAEMAHVSWPTKRQALIYTVIVIVLCALIGALLGLFDSIFAAGIQHLI